MPGFRVPAQNDASSGGHGRSVSSRREYYYNYYWEVFKLFEDDAFTQIDSPLIALREATLPIMTVNKERYNGASLEYKFAKSVVWEDIKVSWYDSVGMFEVMKKWRENIWTPECGLSDANHYKRHSILYNYLPTGKRPNYWRLKNSWPSQLKHGELTYTTSDVKIVEVTITYDWAEEFPNRFPQE